jgi:glycosyltransferase involved in cell wall biosynthesis
MKILLVMDYFQPQLGYSESHLIREWQKAHHEVVVLTGNRYFPFPHYSATVFPTLGPRSFPAATTNQDGYVLHRQPVLCEGFARTFFVGHKSLIEKFKPDIVLVNSIASFNAFHLAQLKRLFSYKLVGFDSHLPSEFARDSVLLKQILYTLFRIFFLPAIQKNFDRCIAMQEGTISILKNVYGWKKPISTIDLGTDDQLFVFSLADRKKLRRQYHLNDDTFVAIYSGKLIRQKGIDILLQAFAQLLANFPDSHLVIVGNGPQDYEQECRSIAQAFGNHVTWENYLPTTELPKYYSMADVAVWPLQESTSMNDAAACSLPFIANNEIGARKRISNNNALLYKKGNAKDLAQQLLYLANHPQERKAMGQRGRQLVADKLSWSSLAAQYLL